MENLQFKSLFRVNRWYLILKHKYLMQNKKLILGK